MEIENDNEYIRVFNFKKLISKSNQETLRKIGYNIQNRKYSQKELYDIMYDIVQNYSTNGENDRIVEQNCKEKGVTIEQCKSLLHNIDYIERKYILSHQINNIEENEAKKLLKVSIEILSIAIKKLILDNKNNLEKNQYFDSITNALNMDLFEKEQFKKDITTLCEQNNIDNKEIEKMIYKYIEK